MGKTSPKRKKGATASWSRNVDSKGRLTLGEAFANRTVIVEERETGELVITPARVIPERKLNELYGALGGDAPAAPKAEERKAARASRVTRVARRGR